MKNQSLHIRVEKIGNDWFTDFSWNGKDWKNLWNGKSEDEAHRRGAEFVLSVRSMPEMAHV